MALERITIPFPRGFDPSKHQKAIPALIAKQYGAGFEIDNVDHDAKMITATRQVDVSEVTRSADHDSFEVRLGAGLSKPSMGDKAAAKFEDQYTGYFMTKFEPFLGKATLSPLTDDEARCRGAVSVALGVKPWDVDVSANPQGGFDLRLPKTYVPSKHDERLEEVATTAVGRPGWYVEVDVAKLTARIIPSDPPTFPEVIPFPLDRLGKGDINVTEFGMVLPRPGQEVGPPVQVDWTANSWGLVGGIPRSGKTVAICAIVADSLSNGSELAIVDTFEKRVDFLWCKQWVRDGGWGCESLEAAVATLGLVYEEGQRRARVLAEHECVNWSELPPECQPKPLLVIMDELSALLVTDKIPGGVPKDNPMVQEILQSNMLKIALARWMNKIIAEMGFVRIRMVLSTQVTNAATGVPPSTKSKIGNFVLVGASPSKSARSQAFPDESSVPVVPENVVAGGLRARGSGTAALEGQGAVVYKSYFATTKEYRDGLESLGLPTTSRAAPSAAEIARLTPALDDESDQVPRSTARGDVSPISGKPAAQIAREMGDDEAAWQYDDEGTKLTGFDKANAARAASKRGT